MGDKLGEDPRHSHALHLSIVRASAIGDPLADELVVLRAACFGAVGTQQVILAGKCQDSLPRLLVTAVRRHLIFFEFWHRQSSLKEVENGMFRFSQRLWARSAECRQVRKSIGRPVFFSR
jgi:hypothetical protein